MIEKRLLQIAVAAGSVVPILGGGLGILRGPAMVGAVPAGDLDSHFRYLSGLLLAIGIGYLSAIPNIETRSARFKLLTLIVVVGGVGRLISLIDAGSPSPSMTAALFMELVITPLLAVWQHRIAAYFGETSRMS